MVQNEDILAFCDLLRGSRGIDTRSCVFQTQRLDLIRGKDFARWCRSNPDALKSSGLLKKSKGGDDDLEKQIAALAELLLARNFLVSAQRKFLKPPPGQKRLIKFPKKVLPVTGAESKQFKEDGFYCWTYDRPTPTWVYWVSALCAVGVVLVCLFPVAPTFVKVGVMYASTALLAAIISFLVIRGLVALASYILTGWTVWILPNSLDDNLPWKDAFKPLLSVEEPDLSTKTAKTKHYLTRLVVTGAVMALTFVLYQNTPGQDALKKNVGKYRDDLFDYFNVYNKRDMLGSGDNSSAGSEGKESGKEKDSIFDDIDAFDAFDDIDDIDAFDDIDEEVDGAEL
jgi:translocation protein SEC62